MDVNDYIREAKLNDPRNYKVLAKDPITLITTL